MLLQSVEIIPEYSKTDVLSVDSKYGKDKLLNSYFPKSEFSFSSHFLTSCSPKSPKSEFLAAVAKCGKDGRNPLNNIISLPHSQRPQDLFAKFENCNQGAPNDGKYSIVFRFLLSSFSDLWRLDEKLVRTTGAP